MRPSPLGLALAGALAAVGCETAGVVLEAEAEPPDAALEPPDAGLPPLDLDASGVAVDSGL
ncbi:MAG TPA: hypothetical protein VGK67_40420 [Myxococcales bacterium]